MGWKCHSATMNSHREANAGAAGCIALKSHFHPEQVALWVGSIDSDTPVVGQIMGYGLIAERIFRASSGPCISPDEDRVSRPDQTTTS